MDPQNETNELITDQIRQTWGGLMAMMTAQGATRLQIATLAVATSHAIVELTWESLWPDPTGEPPPGEAGILTPMTDLHDRLEDTIRELENQA